MAEKKAQRQRRGREDWCSPARLPETQVPEQIPCPSPHKPHDPKGSSAGFIILFTPLLLVPVLPAPSSATLWLSTCPSQYPPSSG